MHYDLLCQVIKESGWDFRVIHVMVRRDLLNHVKIDKVDKNKVWFYIMHMSVNDKVFIERYSLQALISQSSMSQVYLAIDQETGHSVVIKQLGGDGLHPSLKNQFEREVKILQQLQDQPHIVKLLHSFTTSEGKHLVMAHYGGGSLADLLQQHAPLPIAQVLQIGIAVAEALTIIHDHHIIHADLKPGNILFSTDGEPYLSDFGAAIAQGRRFLPRGMVLGTYEYLSPEVCNRDAIDSRTDIWSFGVLLYEMLVGKRPFAHDKASHLLISIMTEQPPDLQQLRPEVGDRLADLIYRMLAKDPNQRIPTAELVAVELMAIARLNGFIDDVEMDPSQSVGQVMDVSRPQHNLTISSMLFVGREREMEELHRLLFDPGYRLITLHGSGGMGKTRLALQAAQNYLEETQDDVFMVDLTAVDSPELLVTAIAEAMQFHFFGHDEPETQLLNYLQSKQMLLVLDNFEHIITGASFLSKLLLKALDIQILVTSQERLNIREEWILSLDGLPVINSLLTNDEGHAPAIELFIQAARRTRRNYDPSKEDLGHIKEICTLVEGVPLAIELAAGWINQLTSPEIVSHLQESFDILSTDLGHVPVRHRSIRSVFEYAWELLNPEERQALRRISVFRGGFSLTASRYVVGATLPTLYTLIDKALLRRSPVSGRFNMQMMVRQFAAQKLALNEAEEEIVRTRHAEHYLRHIHGLQADLISEKQLDALQDIESEFSNIRMAWQWASSQADADLLDLGIRALFSFYQLRGRQREGAQIFAQAVAALRKVSPQPQIILCQLLARQGVCNRFIGRLEKAQTLLQESLALARSLGDSYEMAFSLYQLGAAMPNEPGVKVYWEESLTVAEALDDAVLIAEVLNWLAFGLFQGGEFDKAVAALERSLAVRRSLSDHHGLANALTNLGFVFVHLGEYAKAEAFLQEGLQIYWQIGDIHGVAAASNNLSYTALNQQNYEAAQRWGTQALKYFREVGDKKAEGEALGNLGTVALHQQDYELARVLCLQCIELYTELGLPTDAYYKVLGQVALAQHAYGEAKQAFQQALSGEASTAVILDTLTGFATILIHEGRLEQAVSLLTFVQNHPVCEQIVRDRAAAQLASLTAKMPAAAFAAAQQAGQQTLLAEWIKTVL